MEITKAELEKIYLENSNDAAAEKLGVSVPTMLAYLKANNIKLKGAGGHNRKIQVIS